MKNHILASILLFQLCVLLTACGTAEEETAKEITWQGIAPGMENLTDITERTEFYDVTVESEALFDFDIKTQTPKIYDTETSTLSGEGTDWVPIGTQFLQGEPIQLWAKTGAETADIYLYKKDGSRELLLENFSSEYTQTVQPCRWYLDHEGNCYCYGTIYSDSEDSNDRGFLIKILPSGEILYKAAMEQNILIKGLCQMEDESIYLLLEDVAEDLYGKWLLTRLQPDTGEPVQNSIRELPLKFGIYLGKMGSFPAVTGYHFNTDRRVSRIDMAEGNLIPVLFFTGISYGWHDDLKLSDFQVSEKGEIEFLWTESDGTKGLWEKLKMEKVEKIPIIVRGSLLSSDTWFGNKVAQFNLDNDTYHVIVEDCGKSNDMEDFARLTSIQISTGGGPDIINGILMGDYMEGMLEKGVLEELNPYMAASGIREDDYFPLTFASLRQEGRIYSVNPNMTVWEFETSEEILKGREMPEIEKLADLLLARDENGIFLKGYDSAEVLKLFLQGSESLWGMMDWENGSCDFGTPLFGKLLEAAKRYGDDGRKNTDSIAEFKVLRSILSFEGQAQQQAEGRVSFGALSDDGCYPVSEWGYSLSINANSAHKEGAWEFIHFLISEDSQRTDRDFMNMPLHKEAFDAWMQKYIDDKTMTEQLNGVDVISYNGKIITDEMLAEFKNKIETARPLPVRTAPVLDIILEEAGYYFNGSKNADEVVEIINKRVQLYLNERK